MDTISVRGATYTKASVLAKRFKYTPDYIGQLCRANKVDAELVGRSWYVREDSLLVHKNSQYNSYREAEITINDNLNMTKNEPVKILPVLSKTTKRITLNKQINQQINQNVNFKSLNVNPVKYSPDEVELVPQPIQTHKKVVISKPETEKISVRQVGNKSTNLEFTEVPSVILRGKLQIENFESPITKKVANPVTLPPTSMAPASFNDSIARPIIHAKSASFTPARVVNSSNTKPRSWTIVFVTLALSLLVAVGFLTFDNKISYNQDSPSNRLVFNFDSLKNIFYFLTD